MSYISPIENYIKSILKESNRQTIPKVYIKKAIAIINTKLDSPCCNGDAVINLYTKKDNNLTLLVSKLVENMPKKGNIHSLERARKALYVFLGYCCGATNLKASSNGAVINYSFNTNYTENVLNYTVSLFNSSTNVKIGATQTLTADLSTDTLTGSFSALASGTYYIKLVTNFNFTSTPKLITSNVITVSVGS